MNKTDEILWQQKASTIPVWQQLALYSEPGFEKFSY
jgi:hypothetical protein